MNLNYLKIFFRNLKRYKLISAINLAGLSIGILSSLFILEYVFYERSFDGYHEKGNQVYRLVYDHYQNEKLQWQTANSFFPSGKWLKENYSEVLNYAVISRKYNITVSYENQIGDKIYYNEAKTYYASSSLFNLFTIPLVQGKANCLDQPNMVAVSEQTAERYFGKDNPVGKLITVNSTEKYTVSAVFRNIPANSHLQTDFLFSLPTITNNQQWLNTNWAYDYFHTYLLLEKGVDAEEFCKRATPDMVNRNYLADQNASQLRDEFFMQPLTAIHLYSNIEYETEPPGNWRSTNILFGFAIFLLAIAWINYINLITARSIDRAKEIGIKKINGASRTSLITQFIVEAFLFNLMSLLLTLGLFVLINPAFQTITNIRDFSLFTYPDFLWIGVLVFITGILISSIYPALILSSYKPVLVLKGKFKNSAHGLLFRKVLVTAQFIISIVLLIGTLVTFRQASFLMKKEMGVNYNSSLVIKAPQTADNQEVRFNKLILLKNKSLELPEIQDFTFTSDIPGQEINNWFAGRRKGFDDSDIKAYFQIAGDDQFIDFYNIRILAGRKFHQNETASQRTVLMNKLAVERFGYTRPEDAVNQIIVAGHQDEWQVVGIVDDFFYKSIKTAPVPTVITLDNPTKNYLTFRLNDSSPKSFVVLVPKLRALYESIFPDQPFEYFSLDDKMLLDLKPDQTFASVFSVFSGLAILIAVIGIVGLLLITINQNMKEFGLRKVLGAEVGDVLRLLCGQLLVQFAVALLIALPLSYYSYQQWFLANYVHHIKLNFWYCILPAVALAVVIATVIYILSHRAFRMELTQVLKNE